MTLSFASRGTISGIAIFPAYTTSAAHWISLLPSGSHFFGGGFSPNSQSKLGMFFRRFPGCVWKRAKFLDLELSSSSKIRGVSSNSSSSSKKKSVFAPVGDL